MRVHMNAAFPKSTNMLIATFKGARSDEYCLVDSFCLLILNLARNLSQR